MHAPRNSACLLYVLLYACSNPVVSQGSCIISIGVPCPAASLISCLPPVVCRAAQLYKLPKKLVAVLPSERTGINSYQPETRVLKRDLGPLLEQVRFLERELRMYAYNILPHCTSDADKPSDYSKQLREHLQ